MVYTFFSFSAAIEKYYDYLNNILSEIRISILIEYGSLPYMFCCFLGALKSVDDPCLLVLLPFWICLT